MTTTRAETALPISPAMTVPWSMTTTSLDACIDTYGVVVGVDGSSSSRGALRWAAEWAHTHGQQMRVIGAVEDSAHRNTATQLWHRMVRVLEREVQHVSERYPRLRIDKVTEWGTPHRVLGEASRTAWNVVVGTRGLYPMTGRAVPPTALSPTHCPMIVVPSRTDEVRPGGPVVLGGDGAALTVEAAAFAFACASRLGVALTVVGARPGAASASAGPDETVAGFEQVYPNVEVTRRVVSEPIAAGLCDAAPDATLIVVGGACPDISPSGPSVRMDLLCRARRPLAFVGDGLA